MAIRKSQLYSSLWQSCDELRDLDTHLNGGIPARDVDALANHWAVLPGMDAAVDTLERRRDKARQIKHGMMQQLLTGRVRLARPKSERAEASA